MSICPTKHMYSSIHHSLNNKSQKTETAQMLINTRTNYSILECGILLVNVKGWNAEIYNKMAESHGHMQDKTVYVILFLWSLKTGRVNLWWQRVE